MRQTAWVSGASRPKGPLGYGAMRLPPADEAASPGEQSAHPGRQPHSTTTQSPDRQVKLATAPTPAFLALHFIYTGTLFLLFQGSVNHPAFCICLDKTILSGVGMPVLVAFR